MQYKPSHVANSFLYRARQERIGDVDQLKIQKLVYCLNGWNLAIRGEPIVGELFEAWPYGPVLSSLYHEFKHSGRSPIQQYAKDIDPHTGEDKIMMVNLHDIYFSEIFDAVWNKYKELNGLQLSALTHAEGTPWMTSRKSNKNYLDTEEIKQHFIKLARR